MDEASLSQLLRKLRDYHVSISVAQRLQIEHVVRALGPDRGAEELRSLITPILATSVEEQERIHALFGLGAPEPSPLKTSPERKPAPARPRRPRRASSRKRRALLAAGVTLAALLVVVGRPIYDRLARGEELTSPGPAGPATDSTAAPDTSLNQTAMPPASKPAPSPRAGRPAGWWLLVPLAPLLLFLLHELYRALFLRPVVLRGKEARSPFALDARPAEPPFDPEDLRRAAREAARRQLADTVRLSVPRSVAASVAAGGYPTLRYDALTRPSEYLVLIERKGARDQQARLAAELCAQLDAEGVLLKRYFFDADPRVCYEETGRRGVGLAELNREHPGARLLIYSDGRGLTDPHTGDLLPWTRALAAWADRALLTPEPVGRWGLPEAMIADELPVFPATLDGVRAAAEHLAAEVPPDWYAWWERNLEPPEPAVPHVTSREELRHYLGEPGYRWLAACAVYPELHWRLTLLLGSVPELNAEANEGHLLRLVRLPWLRRGSIPDHYREELIAELGPERERAVREAIIRALDTIEENAPEAKGRAGFDRLVQSFLLHRDDPARRRGFLRRLRRQPQTLILDDVVVVRLLQRLSLSRLHLALPERIRRFLYPAGIPALGMRPSRRAALCALAAALLWLPPVYPGTAPGPDDTETPHPLTPGTETPHPGTPGTETPHPGTPGTETPLQGTPGTETPLPLTADTVTPNAGTLSGDTGLGPGRSGDTARVVDTVDNRQQESGVPIEAPRFTVVNGHLRAGNDSVVRSVPVRQQLQLVKPQFLVVHGTNSGSLASTVGYLQSEQAVSSIHLVVGRDGQVVQMVPFDRGAAHVGQGRWRDVTNLNVRSLGVDLVNWGRLTRKGERWRAFTGVVVPDEDVYVDAEGNGWHKYTEAQVQAVIGLYRALREQYPSIAEVIGHADADPGRKIDPGPAFPMERVRQSVLGVPRPE